jgi:hypothetical protein
MDLEPWTKDIHLIFPLEIRKLIINNAFQRNYDIAEYLLFLIKHSEEALTDPFIELLQIMIYLLCTLVKISLHFIDQDV